MKEHPLAGVDMDEGSTDGTVGHLDVGGDVATASHKRATARGATTPHVHTPHKSLKKGVPDSVKAKSRPPKCAAPSAAAAAAAARSQHHHATSKSPRPGLRRVSAPLTARPPPPPPAAAAPSASTPAASRPQTSRTRSATPPGRERTHPSLVTPPVTKRRSVTPTAARSLSTGGTIVDPSENMQWRALAMDPPLHAHTSQFLTPREPAGRTESARVVWTGPRADATPRSAATASHHPAIPASAAAAAASTTTPHNAEKKRKGAGTPSPMVGMRAMGTLRKAAHSNSATWARPAPQQRRAVTMTQAKPVARPNVPRGCIFAHTLPLPPRQVGYNFTVVFDLDQTLVNAHNEDDTVVPRPGMIECLDTIGLAGAERILWTASNEAQAKFVLKKVDGFANHFDYIVTWDTKGWGDRRDYVKDIQRLNRCPSSTLGVDNDHIVMRPHVHSALVVEDYGDLEGGSIPEYCSVMRRLTPFVVQLSRMRPEVDVPSFVRAHGEWVSIRRNVGYYRLPPHELPMPDGIVGRGDFADRSRRGTSPVRTVSPTRVKRRQGVTQTYVSPSPAPGARVKGTAAQASAFQRTSTSVVMKHQLRPSASSPSRGLLLLRS